MRGRYGVYSWDLDWYLVEIFEHLSQAEDMDVENKILIDLDTGQVL